MQILSLEQLARAYAAQNKRDVILIQGLNTWSTAIDMAYMQKALPFLPKFAAPFQPTFKDTDGIYVDGVAVCLPTSDTEREGAMAQIEALPQRIKNMLIVTEIIV
jgi:hypothetical protein